MKKLDRDFIRLYNNHTLTVMEVIKKLNISTSKFYRLRKKHLKHLNQREIGHPPRKPREIKNYTFNITSMSFQVRKKGVYFASLKTKEEAEQYVELMRENNWDWDLRYEIKKQVKKQGEMIV